jgi:hypothetical protein
VPFLEQYRVQIGGDLDLKSLRPIMSCRSRSNATILTHGEDEPGIGDLTDRISHGISCVDFFRMIEMKIRFAGHEFMNAPIVLLHFSTFLKHYIHRLLSDFYAYSEMKEQWL